MGDSVDTVLFSVIAFIGTMPFVSLVQLIATVFAIKMAVEIVISPATMRLIHVIKQREQTDVYELPAKHLLD